MPRKSTSRNAKKNNKVTTVKVMKITKERLDHLRLYKRETYDEIIQKILEILNICRVNPDAAQHKLITLDRQMHPPRKEARRKMREQQHHMQHQVPQIR